MSTKLTGAIRGSRGAFGTPPPSRRGVRPPARRFSPIIGPPGPVRPSPSPGPISGPAPSPRPVGPRPPSIGIFPRPGPGSLKPKPSPIQRKAGSGRAVFGGSGASLRGARPASGIRSALQRRTG